MTVDFLLDGLAEALELERELGVKAVECDRALLAPLKAAPRALTPGSGEDTGRASPIASQSLPQLAPHKLSSRPPQPPTPNSQLSTLNSQPSTLNSQPSSASPFDFVFLHHRPLPPAGGEMMAKIVRAMGRTEETAPIVTEGALPAARIYVVLGWLALQKFFPGLKGSPGQWLETPQGAQVLIVYSPEYILRFGAVTPTVEKIKQDMWRDLKAVMQRLK